MPHFRIVIISILFGILPFLSQGQNTPCSAYRYENQLSECNGVVSCFDGLQVSKPYYSNGVTPHIDYSTDCNEKPLDFSHLVWVSFDLVPCAEEFDMNIYSITGQELAWQLFYSPTSTSPYETNCNAVQGDCREVTFTGYCGYSGENTHINIGQRHEFFNAYLLVYVPNTSTESPQFGFNVTFTKTCKEDPFQIFCATSGEADDAIELSCLSDLPKPAKTVEEFTEQTGSVILKTCGSLVKVWTTVEYDEGSGCYGDEKRILYKYRLENNGNVKYCHALFTIEPDEPFTMSPGVASATQCANDVIPYVDSITITGYCGSDDDIVITGPRIIQKGPNNCDFTCIIYNFTATNPCGETLSIDKEWVVIDGGPRIQLPNDTLFLECNDPMRDEKIAIQEWFDLHVAIDGCGEEYRVRNDYDKAIHGDTCGIGRIHDVMFFTKDNCVRRDTTFGTIVITDSKPPMWNVNPRDKTVDCATDDVEAVFQEWLDSNAGARAVDCCSGVYFSHNGEACMHGENGEIKVDFTAYDDCGFSITESATFTILGDEGTISILNFPTSQTFECNSTQYQEWLDNYGGLEVASDGCGCLSIQTEIFTYSDEGCLDSVKVSFEIANMYGHVRTVGATVKFEDTTPPTIEVVDGEVVATDNCSEFSLEKVSEVQTPCGMKETWEATDECGNTSSFEKNNGGDSQAPVFTYVPEDQTIDCGNLPSFNAEASDNGNVTVSHTIEKEGDGCAHLKYIWTATDECGNSATAETNIDVIDNEPPVFTNIPDAYYVKCSEGSLPVATASDNCGNVEVTIKSRWLNDGAVEENCNNGFGYDVYTVWQATDDCGNVIESNVTVGWVVTDDYTGPVGSKLPPVKVIKCGESMAFDQLSANSQCGNVTISFQDSEMTGEDCSDHNVTRTWVVTDQCGQVLEVTQTLNMPKDNEAPVFTIIPQPITLQCGETLEMESPKVTDNCTNSYDLNISHEDIVLDGCTKRRIWRVVDQCGNAAEIDQLINIEDNISPTIDIELKDKTISCGENLVFDQPIGKDDCSAVEMEIRDNTKIENCKEYHTRTWSFVDACGNQSDFDQTIVIDKKGNPILELIDLKTITCAEDFVFDTPVISNDCTAYELEYVDSEVVFHDCIYEKNRTWIFTDNCGNVLNTQQLIRMEDTSSPKFSEIVAIKQIECGQNLAFDDPVVMEDCDLGEVSVVTKLDTTSKDCIYFYSKKWIATDACGKSDSVSQIIEFRDNMKPEFFVFGGDVVDLSYQEYLEFTFITPAVEDLCSEFTVDGPHIELFNKTCTEMRFDATWIATDACGNTESVKATAFITDVEPIINLVAEEGECREGIAVTSEIIGGLGNYSFDFLIEGQKIDDWAIQSEGNGSIIVQPGAEAIVLTYLITDEYGCTYSQSIDLACKTIGSNDLNVFDIKMYPNPVINGKLMLEVSSEVNENLQVEVLNILGSKIKGFNLKQSKGTSLHELDLKSLQSGTYMIAIKSTNQSFIKKIILSK